MQTAQPGTEMQGPQILVPRKIPPQIYIANSLSRRCSPAPQAGIRTQLLPATIRSASGRE